jgi:hypothetical protein
MRLTPKAGLHALALFALLAQAAAADADSPRGKPRHRTATPARIVLEKRFVGYGITEADARQHAVRQACEWLADNGRLGAMLSPEYLRSRGLVQPVDPTDEEKETTQKIKLPEPVEVAAVKLEVSKDQYDEMKEELQKVARKQRMEERHWLVARVLAGVVALIVVCGGYLRLEEATRGYYTLLLRAAALLVLGVVGAGLWLVR